MVAIRISAAAVWAVVVGGSGGADFFAEDVDERACVPEEADGDRNYAGEDVALLSLLYRLLGGFSGLAQKNNRETLRLYAHLTYTRCGDG